MDSHCWENNSLTCLHFHYAPPLTWHMTGWCGALVLGQAPPSLTGRTYTVCLWEDMQIGQSEIPCHSSISSCYSSFIRLVVHPLLFCPCSASSPPLSLSVSVSVNTWWDMWVTILRFVVLPTGLTLLTNGQSSVLHSCRLISVNRCAHYSRLNAYMLGVNKNMNHHDKNRINSQLE